MLIMQVKSSSFSARTGFNPLLSRLCPNYTVNPAYNSPMEKQHEIEPELERKPPRRVVNRDGKWGSVRPWLIFLVPHVWIAVVAPFAWFVIYLNAVAVQPISATVVSHHERQSRKKPLYSITCSIVSGGMTREGDCNVDETQYKSLQDGDTITVYALPWLPIFSPRLEKDTEKQLGILAFVSVWCLVWCGCCFSLVYAALVPPLRSRSLTRHGTPITGTLIDLKTSRGRSNAIYTVTYSYQIKCLEKKTNKTITGTFTHEFKIRNSDYQSALLLKGQQVTVLIDEKSPEKSILYAFSDYRAIN